MDFAGILERTGFLPESLPLHPKEDTLISSGGSSVALVSPDGQRSAYTIVQVTSMPPLCRLLSPKLHTLTQTWTAVLLGSYWDSAIKCWSDGGGGGGGGGGGFPGVRLVNGGPADLAATLQ